MRQPFFFPEDGPRSIIVCVLFLLHGQVPNEDQMEERFSKLVAFMLALDNMSEISTRMMQKAFVMGLSHSA
jgi:hypothetical protein